MAPACTPYSKASTALMLTTPSSDTSANTAKPTAASAEGSRAAW